MLRYLWLLVRQSFCKHPDMTFSRNVFGDEINWLKGRSVWRCGKCDGFIVRQNLHLPKDA